MSISAISSTGSYAFLDRLVMNSMNKSSKTQSTETDASDFAAKIINKEDKNGDGKISASESAVDSTRFNELDTNEDGLVTSDELQSSVQQNEKLGKGMTGVQGMQGPPPPPPPDSSQMVSDIMENTDTDGDGVLSVSETGLSSEEFSILDTDSDGSVTTDELKSGIEARKAEMDEERETMASEASQSTSTSDTSLESLLESLTVNDASNAYSDQSWYSLLQSSAQNLSLSA